MVDLAHPLGALGESDGQYCSKHDKRRSGSLCSHNFFTQACSAPRSLVVHMTRACMLPRVQRPWSCVRTLCSFHAALTVVGRQGVPARPLLSLSLLLITECRAPIPKRQGQTRVSGSTLRHRKNVEKNLFVGGSGRFTDAYPESAGVTLRATGRSGTSLQEEEVTSEESCTALQA